MASKNLKEQVITVHSRNVEAAVSYMDSLGLPAQTVKDIKAFKDWCFRQGLGDARVLKYIQILSRLAAINKTDFRTATREDYEKIIDWILQSDLSEWTKQSYRVAIKKFAWWIANDKRRKSGEEEFGVREYPKEAKWINTTMKKNFGYFGVELPKELINEEEAVKLIKAAANWRDKALIAVLFETGLRASELLMLRIRDVDLSGSLGHLIVSGKTGQRRLGFVWSKPYLREWLNVHPDVKNQGAPLWCGFGHSEHMTYPYMVKILRKANKKSGLDKEIHPHLFRHSAATRLARTLSQAQLCDYFGWSQGSKMASVYIHRAGLNTDDALLGAHGIIERQEEFENSELKPKICANCGLENPGDFRYCGRCASPLTMQVAMSRDEKVKAINKIGLDVDLEKMSLEEARIKLGDVLLKLNGRVDEIMGAKGSTKKSSDSTPR